MGPEAAFIFGAVSTFVITLVVSASMLFRPRFIELIGERDEWRNRALMAEDQPGATIDTDARMTRVFVPDSPLPDATDFTDWLGKS